MSVAQTTRRQLDLPPGFSAPREPLQKSWFRPDVHGLRAVAVLLLVLYHAGVPAIRGGYVGVDVFLVICGFVITLQLTRELAERGTISISRFYARRAARILPAAAVVVAVTLAAAWYWLPAARLPSIAYDALATAYYGLNYRLAAAGTDYLVPADTPSPLQHLWSLAVVEQFYLVWPLLLLLLSLVWLHKRRKPSTVAVVAALGVLAAASFAFGVWQTEWSAAWAFFGAPARAWELAVGALLGVLAGRLRRLPAAVAWLLGWAGLAAIITAAVIFNARTAFPGYAAALPVLGAAAVIAAGCRGDSGRRRLPAAFGALSLPPLQGIGRLSYSWYLWHWPLVVIAPIAFDMTLTTKDSLWLAFWSLVLAGLTYALVEDPARTMDVLRSRPWRGIMLSASLSAAMAGLVVLAVHLPPDAFGIRPQRAADAEVEVPDAFVPVTPHDHLLAAAVKLKYAPADLTPALDLAAKDKSAMYRDGCDVPVKKVQPARVCEYGDRKSNRLVVLFGDSHAGSWFPALEKIAREQHWKLRIFTKTACSAASTLIHLPELNRPYNECVQWRKQALDQIKALRPGLVVMSSNGGGGMPVGGTGDADQVWVNGWLTTIRKLGGPPTRLVLISDTPWPQGDVPECVSTHLTDLRECARPFKRALNTPRRREMLADYARREGVKVIDPAPWFCTPVTCPVVVGNVLVYKDGSHVTTAYSLLLAPILAKELS